MTVQHPSSHKAVTNSAVLPTLRHHPSTLLQQLDNCHVINNQSQSIQSSHKLQFKYDWAMVKNCQFKQIIRTPCNSSEIILTGKISKLLFWSAFTDTRVQRLGSDRQLRFDDVIPAKSPQRWDTDGATSRTDQRCNYPNTEVTWLVWTRVLL